jgi:hypothetical protein
MSLTANHVTGGTISTIEWGSAIEDGGGFWTEQTPTRVYAPVGVRYMEPFFRANDTTDVGLVDQQVRLLLNGVAVADLIQDDNNHSAYGISFGLFEVTAGDYFEIQTRSFSTSSTYQPGEASFALSSQERFGFVAADLDGDTALSGTETTLSWLALDPALDSLVTHDGTTGFVAPSECAYAVVTLNASLVSFNGTNGEHRLYKNGVDTGARFEDATSLWAPGACFGIIEADPGDTITVRSIGAGSLDATYTRLTIEWIRSAQGQDTTGFNGFAANLTPVGSWGTLRRNSAYSGPAIAVDNNISPGSPIDVFFQDDGKVRGPIPYGANGRVVTIYDQFGSADLLGATSDDVRIVREDGAEYDTWQLRFISASSDQLATTETTSGDLITPASFELPTLLFAASIRQADEFQAFDSGIFGVEGGAAQYAYALISDWTNARRGLKWELDDNGVSVFNNGNPATSPIAGGHLCVIGDLTQGVNFAYGYLNGELGNSYAYNRPISYPVGAPLQLGDTAGNNAWRGRFIELNIFDHTTPATAQNIADLNEALKEFGYRNREGVRVKEQNAYAVTGTPATGVVAREQYGYVLTGSAGAGVGVRDHLNYVVTGAAAAGISVPEDLGYVVVGASPTGLSSPRQRIHAIIVP